MSIPCRPQGTQDLIFEGAEEELGERTRPAPGCPVGLSPTCGSRGHLLCIEGEQQPQSLLRPGLACRE